MENTSFDGSRVTEINELDSMETTTVDVVYVENFSEHANEEESPNPDTESEFPNAVHTENSKELPNQEVSSNLYIGMEFQSPDEAYKYYNNYAKSRGFGIRKNRIYRSRTNKAMIGQDFVCWKEGTRAEKYRKREDRVHAPPDETRVGCNAMLVVSKREEGKWVISRFIEEHNHVLTSPRSTHFIRSHRKKTNVQKNLIDVLDESGIRPSKIVSVLASESGGIENIGVTERDVFNYLSSKRQKDLEKGDAQLMLDYFQDCQLKNPGFVYAIQEDIDGRLANCFWADARSRMAYKYFGDVVTFDPTYLTNKYKLPFVPFAGVNHHFQSILFGCALIWDETEETFVWLLKTWLDAMMGSPPLTVITDQDSAITNAVAQVLPNTTHHFCMWHIEKKFPEHLSRVYHQNNDFQKQFNKCIHHTITPEEFESEWADIIKDYDLQDHAWLKKIYSIREKWVPAFLRNTFCGGMSTTQRSESLNKFFKDYVNSSTSVSKFVKQFDKAVDSRYHKEREKNFKTINFSPIVKTFYPMEKEALEIYTRKIFKMFQDELLHSQQYVADKDGVVGEEKIYKVHEQHKEKPIYIVNFDISTSKASCTCHKFKFMGILCRHALAVLIKKKIHSLPPRYILNRWTRDAKKKHVQEISSETYHENASNSVTLWFNSIMVNSLGLSEKASRSKKHYEYAMHGIQKLCHELDAMAIENDEIDGTNELASTRESIIVDGGQTTLASQVTVLNDPPHVVTKGRPRCPTRIKGNIEMKKKSTTCSLCGQKGHKKTTCKGIRAEFTSQSTNDVGEIQHPTIVHSSQ